MCSVKIVSSIESSRLAPAVPMRTFCSAVVRSDYLCVAVSFLRRRFTPDGPYDSRWDLYGLSAIRVSTLGNFSHIFILTQWSRFLMSILVLFSRAVIRFAGVFNVSSQFEGHPQRLTQIMFVTCSALNSEIDAGGRGQKWSRTRPAAHRSRVEVHAVCSGSVR